MDWMMVTLDHFRLLLLVAGLFFPAIIAFQQKKKNRQKILGLNALFFVVVAALVWWLNSKDKLYMWEITNIVFLYIVCFVPAIIAFQRQAKSRWFVLILALLLASGVISIYSAVGFALGWIAAFIWACVDQKEGRVSAPAYAPANNANRSKGKSRPSASKRRPVRRR